MPRRRSAGLSSAPGSGRCHFVDAADVLQVGFGMDALSSGMLTFASAAGAMTMKMTVSPIIEAFGFRPVLIGNAAISAAFLFCYFASSGRARRTW